jgi:predicted metal-dependent peptidase
MGMIDLSKLSVEDRLRRAKIRMYKRSPFFAYIILHLKIKKGKSEKECPTMCIDKYGNLTYNEKWVLGLDDEQLMGVLAHEVLHMALMHMDRGLGKEPSLFNKSNDLVANDILNGEKFRLPSDGLIPEPDHTFQIWGTKIEKIDEKSSEEIYTELYPLLPKIRIWEGQTGGGGGGSGGEKLTSKEKKEADEKLKGFDDHTYGDNEEEEKKAAKGEEGDGFGPQKPGDKWKKIVAEAANLAKQQGKLPAGLERRIDDVMDSKVGWRHKLYKYVVDQIIHDYTWSMPSKRAASLGIYLPKTLKESVQIVVSIDTSGSISQDELKEFTSELLAIGNSFPNIKMDIIICDAEVHETYELTRDNVDDILSMSMSGGGGTSHIPIYNYVNEHITDAKVIINFTDGFTDFPEDGNELPYDSLWVLSNNGCAEDHIPFGDIIRLGEGDW